jgi:hypothetical protein
MIPAGRYRVRDVVSGAMTDVFDVRPGEPEARARLDLRDVTLGGPEVGGVALLDGFDPASAVVVAVDASGRELHARPTADGAFRFAWRGESMRLFLRHPDADAAGPVVEVTHPDDRVLLRLPAPVRVRVQLEPRPLPPRAGETSPRIRFLDDDATAVLDGDVLRFDRRAPGTDDLWIDIAGFAPLRVGDVALHRGDNDLGAVSLPRGSAVRIRVLRRDGEVAPELVVAAIPAAGFAYQRSLRTAGRTAATLTGLGAGTFQVRAWERFTGVSVWSATLDLDGTNDRDVEIDLR